MTSKKSPSTSSPLCFCSPTKHVVVLDLADEDSDNTISSDSSDDYMSQGETSEDSSYEDTEVVEELPSKGEQTNQKKSKLAQSVASKVTPKSTVNFYFKNL
jgi:hypothetical protein